VAAECRTFEFLGIEYQVGDHAHVSTSKIGKTVGKRVEIVSPTRRSLLILDGIMVTAAAQAIVFYGRR
jgi:hypothetical protein